MSRPARKGNKRARSQNQANITRKEANNGKNLRRASALKIQARALFTR
jgi:hypothetical protein